MNRFFFALPMPPSTNRLYRATVTRNGQIKFYKSSEYANWLARCAIHKALIRESIEFGSSEFKCEIELKRLRKNTDLDNRIKPVLDALEDLKIIDNDKQCVFVSAKWNQDCNKDFVEITLTKVVDSHD